MAYIQTEIYSEACQLFMHTNATKHFRTLNEECHIQAKQLQDQRSTENNHTQENLDRTSARAPTMKSPVTQAVTKLQPSAVTFIQGEMLLSSLVIF